MADELSLLDAVAQAELVRRGEVKPLELVEAAIARLDRLDPELNVLVTRQYERARGEAASGELPDGPLRGVPFLLKDLGAHLAGDPVYSGMSVLQKADWRTLLLVIPPGPSPHESDPQARFHQLNYYPRLLTNLHRAFHYDFLLKLGDRTLE